MNNERKEKFTPGPWRVCYDRAFERFYICTADAIDVVGHANDRADARLIAAAPEMYEVLHNITLDVRYFDMDKIEAILKKARGEA